MINRKKKIFSIQLLLLILAFIIIYLTYYKKDENIENQILSSSTKNQIKQIEEANNKDTFFDIEYTGLDFSGNRYLLKSKEAVLDEIKSEIVYMKKVKTVFYFKDNTELHIWADNGVYNTKTFSMKFANNVEAEYEKSKLFAEKAEYSNEENYLSVYENVRIKDIQANIIADKLLFDITEQKLNITSFKDGNVKANINLNEKRF